MKSSYKNHGFSLTEVLLSIGVLAIGMIFVAGVFPVGIYFTTVSTERTIAAVVADEAFAKLRLYADPNTDNDDDDIDVIKRLRISELRDFNDVFNIDDFFNPFPFVRIDHDPCNYAFAYPSDPNIPLQQKTYYWSALCRLTKDPNWFPNQRLVQVTVFVCKKAVGEKYWYKLPLKPDELLQGDYPRPVNVTVLHTAGLGLNPDELMIEQKTFPFAGYGIEQKTFINDGYTIVDNATGQLYRVLERYKPDRDQVILLDRPWNPACSSCKQSVVWVVPPAVGGGRNPCIAVYQKLIRF